MDMPWFFFLGGAIKLIVKYILMHFSFHTLPSVTLRSTELLCSLPLFSSLPLAQIYRRPEIHAVRLLMVSFSYGAYINKIGGAWTSSQKALITKVSTVEMAFGFRVPVWTHFPFFVWGSGCLLVSIAVCTYSKQEWEFTQAIQTLGMRISAANLRIALTAVTTDTTARHLSAFSNRSVTGNRKQKGKLCSYSYWMSNKPCITCDSSPTTPTDNRIHQYKYLYARIGMFGAHAKCNVCKHSANKATTRIESNVSAGLQLAISQFASCHRQTRSRFSVVFSSIEQMLSSYPNFTWHCTPHMQPSIGNVNILLYKMSL